MAVRPVLRYPAPTLKRTASSAGPITDELRDLARDLVETMRAGPATVGLAAPQIGVEIRVFALDVSGHRKARTSHGLIVLFDPVVLTAEGEEMGREGCLSVPELTAEVRRSTRLEIEGTTPEGERFTIEMEGFEARAAQHELDHLEGVLILDRVDAASSLFPRRVYL